MKKRKSYAELEPVKKKENYVWRGFVIIIIMIKTKRKTAKTYIPVSHVFKKKVKEGPDYICPVWCFFPCVSQSTRCLLLLLQT